MYLFRASGETMSHFGDQDGKSKTASAVDEQHYPPISKKDHQPAEPSALPTDAEIAERAYHLWLEHGCQEGTDQQNWLEAERELHDAALSRRLTEITHQKAGSVQS
jgi:hypothetical protein